MDKKDRLAQPEPEPVAWITDGGKGELWWHQSVKFDDDGNLIGENPDDIPLYTAPPQQHSEQWWRHEVSNAYAEGYEKGRVFCGCGDQIMPDDGAECGNCVTARNAVKPQPVAQVHVAEDYYPHVIWAEGINAVCFDQEYLYITPPQREWQGLTDEEIDETAWPYFIGNIMPSVKLIVRQLEDKLKEKNND